MLYLSLIIIILLLFIKIIDYLIKNAKITPWN